MLVMLVTSIVFVYIIKSALGSCKILGVTAKAALTCVTRVPIPTRELHVVFTANVRLSVIIAPRFKG